MTTLLSDNIVSALGFTTEENYLKAKQGISGLTYFADRFGLPEPFVASAIDDEALEHAFSDVSVSSRTTYTKLEKAAIVSISDALKGTDIDPSDERVLFILSSTKGNIFLLDPKEAVGYEPQQVYLWRSAELIARYFGNTNTPWVVSNACISGATALVAAQHALCAGRYDYVIVTGTDMLSRFIISGFQSFKALSQEPCKPFDADRVGLNVGEAAATLVLAEKKEDELHDGDVVLTNGAVRNDANHISGPSRTGEGAYLALSHLLKDVDADEIAFVNAHGTATPYNDEMEAVAITRASLNQTPINGLKGYFGHTLGAAGVLESIISTRALRDRVVLKTAGFERIGVSNPLPVVTHVQPIEKLRCINMLSGFGGCNAALLYTLVKQ